MKSQKIWEWEIEKSGNMEAGNREIRKWGLPKSRNPEKSGNVGSRNREIRGNPGKRGPWGLQNGEIRKTGPVGGHFLGQIWPNRPQSGALSGLSCPRAGQDRPGPADSPRGPRNGQICLPLGVYILGSGGRFGPAIYGETYRKSP